MTDRFSVAGRTAFVTGASRGIGRAIAMALAEQGADVAINHISKFDEEIGVPDAAQQFVDEARSHGVKAFAIEGDVSVDGAILDVHDQAADALGRIDILVSNANIQIPCAFEDVTPEQIDLQCRMNYRVPIQLLQRALPPMAESGWGRVTDVGERSAGQPSSRTRRLCRSQERPVQSGCEPCPRLHQIGYHHQQHFAGTHRNRSKPLPA